MPLVTMLPAASAVQLRAETLDQVPAVCAALSALAADEHAESASAVGAGTRVAHSRATCSQYGAWTMPVKEMLRCQPRQGAFALATKARLLARLQSRTACE